MEIEGYKWKYRDDFPGGSVVKNLPASAGDTGSIPGLGRFHTPRSNQVHMPQPLSLGFTTDAAAAMGSLCTAPGEGPPLATTGENLRAATKSWCIPK